MAEVSEDGEGVPLSDGGDQSSSAVDKLSTFMCCSTESADKDRPNSPADLFTCFKNKDEAGDAPPAEDAPAEGESGEAATWNKPAEAPEHVFSAPRESPGGGEGGGAAAAAPAGKPARRQSMAPKPAEEKKRVSIFEAMSASMARAAGLAQCWNQSLV